MNDSIDYKSVDEEIAKSSTERKTVIPAGDTCERQHVNDDLETTLTVSKITDSDNEDSVMIPPRWKYNG